MNSRLQIHRVHRTEELVRVAELAERIWMEHYTPIIGSPQVRYMLDRFQSVPALWAGLSEGHEMYTARDGKALLGYLTLIPDRDQRGLMVSKVYVRADARGSGVGHAFMKFAKGRAIELGIPKLWLTVNRHNLDSIAWYKRRGFEVTGEVVNPIGEGFVMDDFVMESICCGVRPR